MTTADYDLDENDDFTSGEARRENHDIKRLRGFEKKYNDLLPEHDKTKAERDSAQRELAMVRAGIDLDSPTGLLFTDAYKGEPSIEAVKAAAQKYGLVPKDETDPEVLSQQQAQSRLASASQGAAAPSGGKQITQDSYAQWSREQRNAFRQAHPRETEALKRGENIPAIPGFPV